MHKAVVRAGTDDLRVQQTYLAPWRRRHPAVFITLAVTTTVLVVVVLTIGAVVGLLVLFVRALSDPVPVDRHDAATVRGRVAIYGQAVDNGWDLRGSQCTGLVDAEPARRWFPPGPRYAGAVTIDGDDATVIVSSSPTPATAATVASLTFRYEAGAWRYCGVS